MPQTKQIDTGNLPKLSNPLPDPKGDNSQNIAENKNDEPQSKQYSDDTSNYHQT